MEIRVYPKEHLLFSSFLLTFVIYETQFGIGVMGFQRIIVKDAGHDAWISVLIAGLASHVVAWIMLKTLTIYDSSDLYGIHEDVFGKWFGKLFSSVYILFMLESTVVILRNYIEVVQTWLFPEVPVWVFALFLLYLVAYGILGGIRTIVGFCFLSFVHTSWMLALLAYPIRYSHWSYLSPILEANLMELLKGAKSMALTIYGFEILYFIFPFLKEKEKARKYTHLALLMTTLSYLSVMVVSTVYFSKAELLKSIWASLSMFKIIQMPFIERFEFVGVAIWMVVILPNLLLYTWAATRGMKRVFGWSQRNALYVFLVVIFIASVCFKSRSQVEALNDFSGKNSFYIIFLYPFILYGLVRLRTLLKRKARNK